MKNVFNQEDVTSIIQIIEQQTPNTQPAWGKMSVEKMMAHSNVTYEMVYYDKHPKPKGITKFILKLFVKKYVVGEKPFRRNEQTAPQFIIADERKFEVEKKRLIDYINKTLALGASAFEGKESHSFGALSSAEWNVMFSKHLDHHLTQFGV